MGFNIQKLVFAAFYANSTQATYPPVAHLSNGSYTGLHNAKYNQDFFLGIPYAQPPVGNLRFRAPASLNATWTGTKKAEKYSDICVGYGSDSNSFQSSEDCLTINVIKPSIEIEEPLSVVVWIHGGGLIEGSSADLRYNLSWIVQESVQASKPVIGVSFNYRLAAFGFLWSKEVKAYGVGNIGLRDQRLALHWIQENIAAFGGDPKKVTLWGESAGGYSIGKQLLAYGGRDDKLFRGAIMESGPVGENWPYAVKNIDEYNEALYQNLTASTGCKFSPSPLECLRGLPFETLNNAQNISSTTALGPWVIPVDGGFVREYGSTALKNGRFVKVPILLGTNTDEGTVAGPGSIVETDSDFEKAIALGGPDDDTIRTLTYLYPNINAIGIPKTYTPPPEVAGIGHQYKRSAVFFGDAVEHAPRRLTSIWWSKHSQRAFSFRFDITPFGVPDYVGAAHFQEIPWVFGNVDGVGYDINPMGDSSKYREVAKLMNRMWISFVVEGDPNKHGVDGIPYWPLYDSTSGVGQNFVFNGNKSSYVEIDDWRAAGIEFIMDKADSQWSF